MSDLFVALGLVLVIEGVLYAAFPGGMRNMIEQMGEMTDQNLRTGGIAALCIGVAIVWLVRG
ncbi:MAG: DUF2065 domain-containing protein [Rhizobiaceae bacterium]|nr:DUF2065 domain-containing protein [Rhizobiaceae bacterium]